MIDNLLELERLRLEFIKRRGDTEALFRAELTMQDQYAEPVILSDATTTNGLYCFNISINTYADIDDIREYLENKLMTRIISYKEFGVLDCPEAKKPEFKSGRGQFSDDYQLEDIKLCLKIYDLSAAGKSVPEIAKIVYDNNNDSHTEKNSWDSDCQKVRNHIIKARKLIESAEDVTFPQTSK